MTKAKQQTCIILVYKPFQANGWCADVTYKGNLLNSFVSVDKNEAISSAVKCALERGFNGLKFMTRSGYV